MDGLPALPQDGETRIPIDHCFDVKGVGTVILGKVAKGTVRAYDKLRLFQKVMRLW